MTEANTSRLWLWLSLGLNVLLAGVIIGAVAYRAQAPRPPDTVFARIAPPGLLPALPPAQREAFKRDVRRLARDTRAEMRAARSDLVAQVGAETFDRDAALAAFDRMRAARDGLGRRADALVVDVLADLPASQRRAVAQAIARSRERAPPRRAPPPPGGTQAGPPEDARPDIDQR